MTFNRKALPLTCDTHAMHVLHMPKMIQIRNVPDALHNKLRIRAAQAGMSLSDYLQGELIRSAEQFSVDELRQRLEALEPVAVSETAASVLRHERNSR